MPSEDGGRMYVFKRNQYLIVYCFNNDGNKFIFAQPIACLGGIEFFMAFSNTYHTMGSNIYRKIFIQVRPAVAEY